MDAAEIDVAFNSNCDIVLSLLSPFAPNKATIKARTSGVLLVAGVGSFFAYRVVSNLLGNRFVWECLEARNLDQLPTADRRLLYSFNIDEDDDEEEVDEERREARGERLRNDSDETRSVRSLGQVSLCRLNRARRSIRQSRGLLGSLNPSDRHKDGIVSRQSSRSVKSGVRSTSSSFGSMKSASFRIVWEGSQPSWDDYGVPTTSAEALPKAALSRIAGGCVPSTSAREDLASVGDLCSVFNDVMSVTSAVEGNDALLLDDDDYREDDEGNESIWQKCMAEKYMYESFAIEPSESGSHGVYDDEETMSKPTANPSMLSPMDSDEHVMTRSSNSKRSRSMYDSAIGGELSSDDGSSYNNNNKRLNVLEEADSSSIVAPSCASLEWCDDIARFAFSRVMQSETGGSPLRRANLDWDMESEMMDAVPSVSSSCIRDVNATYAPKSSRDLMVMACEMFPPYSPPFKAIKNIYYKRRLKRVGLYSPTETTMSLMLRSALYHRVPILRNQTRSAMEAEFREEVAESRIVNDVGGRVLAL
ncbi:unnamed protein product [Caenorhabditis bovis]|uniref:Uncharacterized protein n=1 Tax=Caenorhabditis bovis TaxID=2654633 RepID=A0A8S1EGD3_9PELO|nr:unnamed protein product [Caenorhabditis bovis]